MKIKTLLYIPSLSILLLTSFFKSFSEDGFPKEFSGFVIDTPVHYSIVSPVDVAQFARVVSWNPSKNDGTAAIRSEEFPKKDLFTAKDIITDSLGHYPLMTSANGFGCIGLKWLNQRTVRELGIQFMNTTQIPSIDSVQVQGWFGESTWQGTWKSLKGTFTINGGKLVFNVSSETGEKKELKTQEIRWIFPVSSKSVTIRKLSAFTRSSWERVTLVVETENFREEEQGAFTVYNGELVGVDDGIAKRWTFSKPLHVDITYSLPSPSKSDPTVLRFHFPRGDFSVAVEDILENGCVYVPEHNLFIAKQSANTNLTKYKKEIANRKTILQKVQEMPTQTLSGAMAKTHHEIQKNGPVMLSLAYDNVKFLVQRSGDVQTLKDVPVGYSEGIEVTGEMQPIFGMNSNQGLKRNLEGGWMPIPVNTIEENGVLYTQRTFVAPVIPLGSDPEWLNYPSVCAAEFTVKNITAHVVHAKLMLAFSEDIKGRKPARLNPSGKGYWVRAQDGEKIALVSTEDSGMMQANIDLGKITLQGELPPGVSKRYIVYFPGDGLKAEDLTSLPNSDVLLNRVKDYWKVIMAPAMHIEIPDTLLQNIILSSQVRCMIDSRNEADKARIKPWVSADRYAALGSEGNSVIRGMDYMGHAEFAKRSLDYFIHQYNVAGFLTTGYTTFATGWNLWTLGEHYQLYKDSVWLKRVAPAAIRAGQWIFRQMEKTKELTPAGQLVPEYGLMPPGVLADWNAFAYHFCMNAYYYAGLNKTGLILAQMHYPEGEKFIENAEELLSNLHRAYYWTQSLTPVLPLSSGMWVTPYPSQLFSPGKLSDFFPGQDAGRSWAYDVELGAHQLVPAKVLNANSREVTDMINHMEDVQFLAKGWQDYESSEKNRMDWFDLGGFSKVQPYYTRITEIYAMRNEVKPFIRSYFNALASLINPETLTIWEHFHNVGAPDKTHETGNFLYQTRIMLLNEHDHELWLAPLIPANWMKDGMTVGIEEAPTNFGKVSYRIQSHIAQGYIEATITPPTRQIMKSLQIRLPHPEGKLIRSVTINGRDSKQFDPIKGTVSFDPELGKTVIVRAKY